MAQLVKRHCLGLRDLAVTTIRNARVELMSIMPEYDLVYQMGQCVMMAKSIISATEVDNLG